MHNARYGLIPVIPDSEDDAGGQGGASPTTAAAHTTHAHDHHHTTSYPSHAPVHGRDSEAALYPPLLTTSGIDGELEAMEEGDEDESMLDDEAGDRQAHLTQSQS